MATAGSNQGREARRRRIVDRGSDRLALITGRIQSTSADLDHPDKLLSDSPRHEDKVFRSLSAKHESVKEFDQLNIHYDREEPLLHKNEDDWCIERSRAAVLLDHKEEPTQVSSLLPKPAIDHRLEQQSHHNPFTANQICTAIAASEKTRIRCSMAAAILVILSYIGFPIVGWCIFRSIIVFRPLYLLLITNITIVLAWLLLEKEGRLERQTSGIPSASEDGLIDQVGKALELGLLLQNFLGALFMDCSIYAVVLVCGLSVAQRLGW